MREMRSVYPVVLGIAALTVLIAAAQVPVAYAHALLERSEPAAGSVAAADKAPTQVSLWFSEPVSVASNSITVLDAENHRIDKLDAHVSAADPERVDVSLDDLNQGAYVVRWQATSADNHVVRGSYWYAVGFATAPPAGALAFSDAPSVPPLEVLGRGLLLIGVLGLAGSAAFLALFSGDGFGSPAATGGQKRVWFGLSGSLMLGQLAWAVAQAESVAGLPAPQALSGGIPGIVLFGSGYAVLWWSRTVLGALLLIALLRASSNWLTLPLSAFLVLSVSLGSHAAAARVFPLVAVTVDVIHLMAAAVWLGGLLQVVVLLRVVQQTTSFRRLVPKLSTVALISVGVLVLTGFFSAWEQVASVDALLATPYGQTLLLKVGLVVCALVPATVNLLYIRPRAKPRLARPFRRLIATEVAIGGVVLFSAGTLSALPPPGSASLPGTVESTRQVDDMRVTLAVDPNWVGISRFRVTLTDPSGQPPADVQQVVYTFAMQGMNMGRTTVFASALSPGTYESDGFYVGMPGISQVGVSISRANAADASTVFLIEVPDLNHKQFDGLRASLGVSPVGLPSGEADVARGQAIYTDHCVVCHGETGVGNGPAAASLLPPPSDLTLHARWHPDEQLYWFITNGVAGTAMPAWGDQLSPLDRRDVIGYLHELANAPSATPLVAPAPSSTAPPTPVAQPTASAPSAAAVVSAAPTVAPVAATAAATPNPVLGLTGRLAFGPDNDGNLWVWRFPAEKPEKLTAFGPGEYSSNPVWSPDASEIAFSYYKLPRTGSIPIPDGTDLYVANGNGSEPRMLAQHDAKGVALQFPAWSPDGKSIFVAYRDLGGVEAHIDRVDVESGQRTQVVSNAGYPALAPDGTKLAYATSPAAGPKQGGTTLMWSNVDGSDPHLILGPQVFQKFYGLRISPDGKRLLFAAIGAGNNFQQPQAGVLDRLGLLASALAPPVAYADGEIYDVWTIGMDGRDLQRVTQLAEDLPIATWAPDGRQIAFLGGGSASFAQSGLAVVNPDGSQLRRLTGLPGHRGIDWTAAP